MEVPLLKTWIHTHVLEGITKGKKINPNIIGIGKGFKKSVNSVNNFIRKYLAYFFILMMLARSGDL